MGIISIKKNQECPKCGKSSMMIKEYRRKADGEYKKVEICFSAINGRPCGYKHDYTPNVISISESKRAKQAAQGQMELKFN